MGGYVAGHISAEEELRRQARLEESKNLHRDVVEVVAETMKSEAMEPWKPQADRRPLRPKPPARKRGKGEDFEPVGPVKAVVDFKV